MWKKFIVYLLVTSLVFAGLNINVLAMDEGEKESTESIIQEDSEMETDYFATINKIADYKKVLEEIIRGKEISSDEKDEIIDKESNETDEIDIENNALQDQDSIINDNNEICSDEDCVDKNECDNDINQTTEEVEVTDKSDEIKFEKEDLEEGDKKEECLEKSLKTDEVSPIDFLENERSCIYFLESVCEDTIVDYLDEVFFEDDAEVNRAILEKTTKYQLLVSDIKATGKLIDGCYVALHPSSPQGVTCGMEFKPEDNAIDCLFSFDNGKATTDVFFIITETKQEKLSILFKFYADNDAYSYTAFASINPSLFYKDKIIDFTIKEYYPASLLDAFEKDVDELGSQALETFLVGLDVWFVHDLGKDFTTGDLGFTAFNAPGTHTWGEWEIIKETTDEEEGVKRRICRICNAEEEVSISEEETPEEEDEGGDGSSLNDAINVKFGKEYSNTWYKNKKNNVYYKLQMVNRGILTVTITKPNISDERLDITLYDENLNPIWDTNCYEFEDRAAPTCNTHIGIDKGKYYITVKPHYSYASNSFNSKCYFTADYTDFCEIENNNSFKNATELQFNHMYIAHYGGEFLATYNDESDYYKFNCNYGSIYRICIDNYERIDSTSCILFLYYPSGNEKYLKLNSVDENGYNYYEFEAPETGTYYIYLYNYLEDQFEYKIGVMKNHFHVGKLVEGIYPTCTKDGILSYYICDCGLIFEDIACTREITDLDSWKIVPAYGHNFSLEFMDEDEHWFQCVNCGEITEKSPHIYDDYLDKTCNGCSFSKGLSMVILGGNESYTYTGSAIKPQVIVRNYGKILTEGRDYTISYKNNVNASVNASASKKPVIIVKGKGNYSGTTKKYFEITPCPIADVCVENVIVLQGKKAAPVLLYYDKKLTTKDYTNLNASKIFQTNDIITLMGKGNFTGTRNVRITVVKRASDLKKFSVTMESNNYIYDGEIKTASYVVQDSVTKKILKPWEDYWFYYSGDMENVGTVKVTFIGMGEYSGSVVKSFKIVPNKLPSDLIYISGVKKEGYTYEVGGVNIGDDLTVAYGDKVLIKDKDYTVTCSNNTKVGTAKYTVKFIGNYKGSKNVTGSYTIQPAVLNNETEGLKISTADVLYAGKPGTYISKPVVSIKGALVKTSDYTVTYYQDKELTKEIKGKNNNIIVGNAPETVYVKVTGKGNFGAGINAFATTEYKVCPNSSIVDLKGAKILFKDQDGVIKTKFEYTGKKLEPEVIVQIKSGKNWIAIDSDKYLVEYHNNILKGKATVVVKAKDESGYAGGKSASFNIVSQNVTNIKDLWRKIFS